MKRSSRNFKPIYNRVSQLNMESSRFIVYFGRRSILNWVLLCIVTLVSITTVFGGSSSNIIFDSVASEPESNDYGNCRTESSDYSNCTTLKSQDSVESLELNPFTGQGEFGLCRSKKENYVPCYGVPPGYLLNEFDNDDDFDRHCEVFRSENRCLVPPPKGYKIPSRWPAGRDLIWSENVKMEENKFISPRSLNRRSVPNLSKI